jgi:hypothetical protein
MEARRCGRCDGRPAAEPAPGASEATAPRPRPRRPPVPAPGRRAPARPAGDQPTLRATISAQIRFKKTANTQVNHACSSRTRDREPTQERVQLHIRRRQDCRGIVCRFESLRMRPGALYFQARSTSSATRRVDHPARLPEASALCSLHWFRMHLSRPRDRLVQTSRLGWTALKLWERCWCAARRYPPTGRCPGGWCGVRVWSQLAGAARGSGASRIAGRSGRLRTSYRHFHARSVLFVCRFEILSAVRTRTVPGMGGLSCRRGFMALG